MRERECERERERDTINITLPWRCFVDSGGAVIDDYFVFVKLGE